MTARTLFTYIRTPPPGYVHNGVLHAVLSFRMTNGATYQHGSYPHWGCDPIHVQEESNNGFRGSRWSHTSHCDYDRLYREQNAIYPHVSFANSMERGVLARRTARREYALCQLEKNYSPKVRQNFTEFAKSVQRKYKDERCKSPRFILRNKSVTVDGYATKKGPSARKTPCHDHRRAPAGPCRDRVLQALGSDLVAPWLTVIEMYSTKCAFRNDWQWERVWRGRFVRAPASAVRVRLCLQLGYNIADIHPRWGTRNVMDGVWGFLTSSECSKLAEEYKDIKTLRKLM